MSEKIERLSTEVLEDYYSRCIAVRAMLIMDNKSVVSLSVLNLQKKIVEELNRRTFLKFSTKGDDMLGSNRTNDKKK